jgi:hypothetical protein
MVRSVREELFMKKLALQIKPTLEKKVAPKPQYSLWSDG